MRNQNVVDVVRPPQVKKMIERTAIAALEDRLRRLTAL